MEHVSSKEDLPGTQRDRGPSLLTGPPPCGSPARFNLKLQSLLQIYSIASRNAHPPPFPVALSLNWTRAAALWTRLFFN
jgi:hypothetical protein